MLLLKIVLIICLTIVTISLIWRLLSQRINIPCPSWLHWLVELDNPFAKVCHAKFIVENLDITPGMKVLDAGAGSGRVTIPLAEKVEKQGEVTALDIQTDMLDIIQKKAQSNNLHNIKLLQAGLGEDKLEQNYYDRAVLVTVLGEIPDQRAALQEIYNALKLDGILSVSEMIFDPHFQPKRSVTDLAQSVGFKKTKLFGSWFAYTIQFEKQL